MNVGPSFSTPTTGVAVGMCVKEGRYNEVSRQADTEMVAPTFGDKSFHRNVQRTRRRGETLQTASTMIRRKREKTPGSGSNESRPVKTVSKVPAAGCEVSKAAVLRPSNSDLWLEFVVN